VEPSWGTLRPWWPVSQGAPQSRRPWALECNRFAVGCSNCARQSQARTALARQIEHKDAEIDRVGYELYGLTAEEIALVEGATA
jgi:hypothetical protein